MDRSWKGLVSGGMAVAFAVSVGATPAAAVEPDLTATARVAGVITTHGTITDLDPLMPWLVTVSPLGPAGWHGLGTRILPRIDAVSLWRMSDVRLGGHVEQWRDGWIVGRSDPTDKRLAGIMTTEWDSDVLAMADHRSAAVLVVTVRLVSGGGSWAGVVTGIGDPTSGAFELHGTLDGDGDYAGASAVLDIAAPDVASHWDLEAFVFPGRMPVG